MDRLKPGQLLILIFILIIPLAYLSYFHLENLAYPVRTEGYYFSYSQINYNLIINGNFGELVDNFFRYNGFGKPSLTAILPLPFLFICHGNVRLAILIYSLFFYTVLQIQIVKFLTQRVIYSATLIGLASVSFLPWLIWSGSNFSTELAFLTASVGFFSNFENLFGNNRRTSIYASLWLCFMALVRPAEAFAMAFPLIAMKLEVKRRQEAIRKWNYLPVIFQFVFLGATILLSYFALDSEWSNQSLVFIFIFAIALVFLPLFSPLAKNLNQFIQLPIAAIFSILIIWFAPKSHALTYWILDATYGASTKVQSMRPFMSNWSWFYDTYLAGIGISPILFAGIALLRGWKNIRTSVAGIYKPAIPLLIMLLIGLASNNDVSRFYYASWTILCLFLVREALSTSGEYFRLRMALVVLCGCFLGYNIMAYDLSPTPYLSTESKTVWPILGERLSDMRVQRSDPYENFADDLISRSGLGPEPKSIMVYVPTTAKNKVFRSDIIDIIVNDKHYNWRFSQGGCYFCTDNQLLTNLLNQFDFVLVGPQDNSWESDFANDRLGQNLLKFCNSGDVQAFADKLKFKYLASVPFRYFRKVTENYCLLKIIK